jgi:predicted nucleic acid-binding protein
MAVDHVLVDSSVWIFALRKATHPEIVEQVDKYLKKDSVACSWPIKLELLGGTRGESDYLRLKTRLDALHEIEIREDTWESASKMAFELRQKGVTVPHMDILISAAAIQSGATLLHADAHFDLIARHTPLKCESLLSLLAK